MRNTTRRERGFTVVELLIIVSILGLIFALLIPNFLVSLNTAKQKRTLTDMRAVGRATMAWLTDHAGAAAAGANMLDLSAYGPPIDPARLREHLIPVYMASVPQLDGWGYSFQFFVNEANSNSPTVLAIRSPGYDGAYSGGVYEWGGFESTDFAQDLVWADGNFVRWPRFNPPRP